MQIKRAIGIGYWQNQSNNDLWTKSEVQALVPKYFRIMTRYDPQVTWIREIDANKYITNYRNFEGVYYATSLDPNSTTPQAWLDAGATGKPPEAWNEWFDFVANDVVLKNANGDYLINKGFQNERMIDPANPWFRYYLKKYCENRIATGYSAIFGDCLRPFLDMAPWHYGQKPDGTPQLPPINPRTGNVYTNDEYAKDVRDLVDYIKTGTNIKIIANGIPQADGAYGYYANKTNADLLIEKLDGQMIEGSFGWNASDFNSRSIDKYVLNLELLKQLAKAGKANQFHNVPIGTSIDFLFCSFMLALEDIGAWDVGVTTSVDTSPRWIELTDINPGKPLGDYVRNGNVFTREFENIKITLDYVNRTSSIEFKPKPKTEAWNGFALAISEPLSTWESALTKGDKWGFNVIRVVVRASTYNKDKLDQVLALIDAHGAKAVIDNHLLSQWVDVDPKFGSQAFRDNWVKWVSNHRYDDRIIAWELANEPFYNVWDGVNVKVEADVIPEFAKLTDLVRAIDPNRPIVWMVPYNINPAGNLRNNIVVTFHPYLYNSHSDWTTIENILNYRKLQMRTCMAFGYSAGWIGEIETKANITVPLDLNMRYVSEIISYGVEKNYGFNYWKYHLPWDDGHGNQDTNIANSTYEAPEVITMVEIKNEGTNALSFVVRKIVITETPYTVASGSSVTVAVADSESIVFK